MTVLQTTPPRYILFPYICFFASKLKVEKKYQDLVERTQYGFDIVILYQLCHIKEHNHGERFYRLLTQQMPEWKKTKQQLDDMAELLLNE